MRHGARAPAENIMEGDAALQEGELELWRKFQPCLTHVSDISTKFPPLESPSDSELFMKGTMKLNPFAFEIYMLNIHRTKELC